MKHSIIVLICGAIAIISPVQGTVTLNTFFGIAYESDGVSAVSDGDLWALIVDDGDEAMPGGLEINSSLQASKDESTIALDFGGMSLSVGTVINGDTVFAMGGFNGLSFFGAQGYSSDSLEFTLGVNGLESGRIFGFYWFPGISYAGGAVDIPSIGPFQVGGISEATGIDSGNGLEAMIVPADAATINVGAGTADVGGSLPASRFTAVAIPEPSTLVLLAFGTLGMVRRRR